jgi:hypothetical protein
MIAAASSKMRILLRKEVDFKRVAMCKVNSCKPTPIISEQAKFLEFLSSKLGSIQFAASGDWLTAAEI